MCQSPGTTSSLMRKVNMVSLQLLTSTTNTTRVQSFAFLISKSYTFTQDIHVYTITMQIH
jgi:hypothetical protein